jgi:hypothetical protein
VKGKAWLVTVVHKKTAAALAIQEVKSEDQRELATLVSAAKANLYVFCFFWCVEHQGLILYSSLDKYDEQRRQWGGGIRGNKSTAMIRKRAKAIMWFSPYLANSGFWCPVNYMLTYDTSKNEGTRRTLASFSLSAAIASRRAFFSCFDSGRYLLRSLNSCMVFLSKVCENWAIAGEAQVQNDLLAL